ncbi:MAG TPA: glycosyltransferase [Gammaproteobacteria bacterium]|nr:glycosyltransferase [Gammaproteobacteria bacterium]
MRGGKWRDAHPATVRCQKIDRVLSRGLPGPRHQNCRIPEPELRFSLFFEGVSAIRDPNMAATAATTGIPVGPPVQFPPSTPSRPFLSVMIPASAETDHLLETLESVLAQDLGPGIMQIEVIDNSSAEGLGETLAERFRDRVSYFRHALRVSATRSWNTCLERARGEWTHILLANDVVRPDFYTTLRRTLEANPGVEAFACRCALTDDEGFWLGLSEPQAKVAGCLPAEFPIRQIVRHRLNLSSLVIRRDFFEQFGGFQERLRYCADWDLCNRLALKRQIFYDPHFLVSVREHEGEGRFLYIPSGENVAEARECLRIYAALFPGNRRRTIYSDGMTYAALDALRRCRHYRADGKAKGARRQLLEAGICMLGIARSYAMMPLRRFAIRETSTVGR